MDLYYAPSSTSISSRYYLLFTFPVYRLLCEIFNKYLDINYHSYADDLQIHLNYTDSHAYCSDSISNCISDLFKWLNSNTLKFNHNKTESIFLHLPFRSNTLPNLPHVIHLNSPAYLVPLLTSPPTTNNTITRSSNTLLLNTPILITPTQPVLVFSPCMLHAIGTNYPSPFVSSRILTPSNVTLKTTIFLKLSHHKLILS